MKSPGPPIPVPPMFFPLLVNQTKSGPKIASTLDYDPHPNYPSSPMVNFALAIVVFSSGTARRPGGSVGNLETS